MPAWALPRKNLRREVMTFPKKVVFARMQLTLHFVVMPIRLQDAANVSRAHDLAMTREQGAGKGRDLASPADGVGGKRVDRHGAQCAPLDFATPG